MIWLRSDAIWCNMIKHARTDTIVTIYYSLRPTSISTWTCTVPYTWNFEFVLEYDVYVYNIIWYIHSWIISHSIHIPIHIVGIGGVVSIGIGVGSIGGDILFITAAICFSTSAAAAAAVIANTFAFVIRIIAVDVDVPVDVPVALGARMRFHFHRDSMLWYDMMWYDMIWYDGMCMMDDRCANMLDVWCMMSF